MPDGLYSGPVCYVASDVYVPRRIGRGFRRVLEGGWHYSTRVNRKGMETPHRKLHLRDDGSYEYAGKHHRSHLDKHGPGNPVILGSP